MFKPEWPLDANQVRVIIQEAVESMAVDREMVRLIEQYKKTHTIALLSNFDKELDDLLRKFEIAHLFDVVANSSIIRMTKPSPQAFWYTLEQMNLEPEQTVFIDDLPLNVQGAQEVGIKGILYTNFDQAKEDLEKAIQ